MVIYKVLREHYLQYVNKKLIIVYFGTGSSKPASTIINAGKTAAVKVPKSASRPPGSKKDLQGAVSKPAALRPERASVDNTENAAAASRREEMQNLDFRRKVAETIQEESKAVQSKLKTYDEGYEFAKKLFADAVKVSVAAAAVGTAASQVGNTTEESQKNSSNCNDQCDISKTSPDVNEIITKGESDKNYSQSDIPIEERKKGEEFPPDSLP